MSTGGYIKLHRKSLTSEVFADPALWRVWTWCLLRANHKPQRFRGQVIPRGSFVTAMRTAAEELGMPRSTIHDVLGRLNKNNMIRTETGRGYTVVSVCKYNTYQKRDDAPRTEAGRDPDARRTRAGQIEETQETKEYPPPTPSANDATEPPPKDAPDWGGVGDLLKSLGMTRRDQAVAAAQAANVAPETVRAIIAHWQSNAPAWGTGALFKRICVQTASGPAPSEGWPLPSEQAERERRRAEAERARQRQQGMLQRQREQAEADAQRLAELEREHGRQINSWPRERMVATLGPLLAKQLPATGPPTGLARAMLLEHAASTTPQPP